MVSFGPPPGVPTPPPEERGAAAVVRFGMLRRGWTVASYVEHAGLAAEVAAGRVRWMGPLEAAAYPDLVVEPLPAGGGRGGAPPAAVLRVMFHARDPGPFHARLRLAFAVGEGGEERELRVAVRATVLRPRDGKPGVRDNVTVLSRADAEAASDDETDWIGFAN